MKGETRPDQNLKEKLASLERGWPTFLKRSIHRGLLSHDSRSMTVKKTDGEESWTVLEKRHLILLFARQA